MEDYGRWLSAKLAAKCVDNLKKNGFDAHWVQTIDQARELVGGLVTEFDSFGFGGSSTTRALEIIELLRQNGKTIYDHWQADLSAEQDLETRLMQGRCDCFMCSANAISISGEIVNVDGIGNRTCAMTFGPRKVIIVAGVNKLAPDLHAALRRVREVAAPMRAKSLDMKTPCAETGICVDCSSPQRICRVTTILHRRPSLTDISVVLINQNLGF